MKFDDRPVIDQLLNPTPLNILDEVAEHMNTLIDGAEYALADWFDVELNSELGWVRTDLDAETRDLFSKALYTLSGKLADAECSRRQALMELMASEMEARL